MSPPPPLPRRRYRFVSCVLDVDARELLVAGQAVDLEPRTFDVLAYLVENRDRVVPKHELLDAIWGDHFVSASALSTQIKHVRSAIGDDGRAQNAIKTVHRIGYRFVVPVAGIDREPAPPRPGGRAPVSAWSVRPSKAVFGRDADLDAVRARLADHRLVTLTGPAGVGKTSLAQQLVDGPDGAPRRFCELADTRDPEAVPNVVLAALGEGQQSDADPTESVLRILEDRSLGLILDNCEHVSHAAAALAGHILSRCPGIGMLATSRQPLGLGDESVYALEPLDMDASVACFAARATAAGAAPDPDDPALRELCARLDGIPLALELAAARSRLLTPQEMLGLLDDRFRLLRDTTGGPQGELSLHAAIATSWDVLEAEAQQVLARLSVLVGSFTLEDARSVALPDADPLDAVDVLEQLVRRSLLTVGPSRGARTTFRLLESVRDFAATNLGDPSPARAAQVAHFTARAEQLDAACQTPGIDEAVQEFRESWPNLRAAVGYASAAGEDESIRRIVRAAAQYADVFAIYEIGDWCELARVGGDLSAESDLALAADALAVHARTLAHQGHHQQARVLADRALRHHESHATLLTVVFCAYYAGQLDQVVEMAPRLVELSRSDRGFDRGYADGFRAIVVAVRQEHDLTSTVVDPAHAHDGVLGALDALTDGLRLCTADPRRAAELLEAVVEASLRHDYRLLLGIAASTLTQITLPARPRGEAIEILRRTLRRYRERRMWTLIAADIVMAGRFLADAGSPEVAARLIGARLASGYASGLSELLALVLRDELAARLGDDYATLVDQGRAWRPPQAAAVAIEGLTRLLDGPG